MAISAAGMVAVVLLAFALVAHGQTEAHTAPPAASSTIRAPHDVRRVLAGKAIGAVRFGQTRVAVLAGLSALLGPPSSGYVRTTAECGVDHTMAWPNWPTVSTHGAHYAYDPVLTVFFHRDRLVGYAYGEYGTTAAPRAPTRGRVLATTRGLTIGDTLARGRQLYGDAFTLSPAQGGVWKAGHLRGFAWGHPNYGDVSPQSVVATIDAGDVGCPALSP